MQTSNKRKRNTVQKNDSVKVSKQSSIANFFSIPKKKVIEKELPPVVADPVEMAETVKVEDLNEKKEFYATSMYTDEFNTMVETVLKDESFLFSVDEIHMFDTYRYLSGSYNNNKKLLRTD